MSPNSPTSKNILAICQLEEEELANRTLGARIGDAIAFHAGRVWFIVLHVAWFASWIALNSDPHLAFDPFPFPFLTMIVSLESIFLSLFILMSQNRSGLQSERRNHLDLQINLLAEDENTKIIQMLQAICEHLQLPIGNDPEVRSFAERTKVTDVIADLQDQLPPQG